MYSISSRIGVAGLYTFAFFGLLSVPGSYLGLLLMLIAFLTQPRHVWQDLKSSPVFWVVVACVIYVALGAALGAREFPETAEYQRHEALVWGVLGMVVVTGWWLRDDPRRFYVAFVLFVLGAVVRIVKETPWDSLAEFLAGDFPRVEYGFGLWNISFSSYLVVFVMGMFFFVRRLWFETDSPRRLLLIGIVGFLAVVFVDLIILARSRGTWLAAVITFSIFTLAYFRILTGKGVQIDWKRSGIAWGGFALLLVLIIAPNIDLITGYAFKDTDTIEQVLSGESEQLPVLKSEGRNATSARVAYWRFGIEKWRERPWFGWGVGSTAKLFYEGAQHGLAGHDVDSVEFALKAIPHLHNIVVEILVRTGVIGLLLVAAVLVLVFRDVWRLLRMGQLPADWFSFLFATLVFSLIWGMFDIRVMRFDYRDFVLLFLGAAVALGQGYLKPGFTDKLQSERY